MSKIYDIRLPAAGEYTRVVFAAIRSMPVWIYRPKNVTNHERIIVAVHGISRDSLQQIQAYQDLADKLGCWLIAPEFSAKAFPGYQQLSKVNGNPRPDLALNQLLMLWRHLLGITRLKMYLCGYSGGAQFCHRYAMLYPNLVASLVVASAGWYSFPDAGVSYPRGVAKWPRWLGRHRLNEMLKLPILILVGDRDTARNQSLRKSARLDGQQGAHRLERAQRWFQHVKDEKQKVMAAAPVELRLLRGQDHEFWDNIRNSDMLQYIDEFLQRNERSTV